MNKERDSLVKNTFHKIRELCNERNIEFIPIELRWGISSSKGKAHIISACLNEIKESHPYFIGIVGDRYGWVPTFEELNNSEAINPSIQQEKKLKIFEQYPWLASDIKSGLSMTEIEMQYAALRNGHDKALFYIKEDFNEFVSDTKGNTDQNNTDSDEIKKVSDLKNKIRNTEGIHVKVYKSETDLADMVFKDVKDIIDKEIPIDDTIKAEEYWHNRSYKQKQGASLYDFDSSFQKLDELIICRNSRFTRLLGIKGCGKSYLLVNYLSHLKNKGKRIYYYDVKATDTEKPNINFIIDFEEYICNIIGRDLGLSIKKTRVGWLRKTIMAYYKIVRYNISTLLHIESPLSPQSIITQLQYDLAVAPIVQDIKKCLEEIEKTQEEIIIALDNIDVLSSHELALTEDLELFPNNIKFIYSSRPENNLWINTASTFSCDGLFRQNIEKYIKEYFKKYGKEDVPPKAVEVIKNSLLSETPLDLNKILDMLVSFGYYDQLENEITRLASIMSKQSLYKALIQTLVAEFDSKETHPITDVLIILALSQKGLTENEIREITSIKFDYWISIRPHIKEMVEITNDYYIPEKDLREAIMNFFPNSLIMSCCDKMIEFFSCLHSFKTNGLGFMEVAEQEQMNHSRQVSELPHLYVIKKDYSSLSHYISFPFNDEYIENKDRIDYWRLLYSQNIYMSNTIDMVCCNSSSKYALKYSNVPLQRIIKNKQIIVDPSDDDVQKFISRLFKVSSYLLNQTDSAWLLANHKHIDIDEYEVLNKISSSFTKEEVDTFISDYESGIYSVLEDSVMIESLVSFAYLKKNDYTQAKSHLILAINTLDNQTTIDFGYFSLFIYVCGHYLLKDKDYQFAKIIYNILDKNRFFIVDGVTSENCLFTIGKSIVLIVNGKEYSSSLEKAVALSRELFGENSYCYLLSNELQKESLKQSNNK